MENEFRDHVIYLIKQSAFDEAKHELIKWMSLEEDRAEIHHLFGVICELTHEIDRAKKHYRASYALDPSYSYARLNLQRLVLCYDLQSEDHLYFGDEEIGRTN